MVSLQSKTETGAGGWTLWGHAPRELHDAVWAARGVAVVRPGMGPGEVGESRWYLAVGCEDGLVSLDEWAPWSLRRGVWEIDARESGFAGYRERIEFIEERSVRAIRRSYREPRAGGPGCYLASDADMALALAHGRTLGGGSAGHVSGALYHAGDDRDVAAWVGTVVEGEGDLASVVPGVQRRDERVWAGDRVRVPEGVRFVGPVCVGRDVTLPSGSVVVGPAIVPDGWSGPEAGGVIAGEAPSGARETAPVREPGVMYRAGKRGFDLVASGLGMVIAAPLAGVIAAAIYLEDGGPIIFRQRRQTRGGREFECLKFRTMVRDADARQAELRAKMLNEVDGPQFAIRNDPRILRIGRWLRRTQLDELPQLWNVFKGEMSLVGPRPSPDRENQYCPAWREARLSVPAGITGLWQVRRRREPGTDFQEWIRYDIEYADRRGVLLDARILAETAMLYVPFGRRARERRRRAEAKG